MIREQLSKNNQTDENVINSGKSKQTADNLKKTADNLNKQLCLNFKLKILNWHSVHCAKTSSLVSSTLWT